MLEEERTESPVSPKSEEIEQEVEIEPDEGPMPTEMEALEDDKEEPKIEEYDAELQVEEPGKNYSFECKLAIFILVFCYQFCTDR